MYLILQTANGIDICADREPKNKNLETKKTESERNRLARGRHDGDVISTRDDDVLATSVVMLYSPPQQPLPGRCT